MNNNVILLTDDGEELEFSNVFSVNLDFNTYVILQPVETLEGMEEDEALVFSLTRVEGNDQYSIVIDDEIIDKVFEEYNRLLDEQED
jgi:hypothetical protein